MATAFERDTAIRPTGDGTWATHLDSRWSINVVPNGGYSTAGMVRAMLETTGRDHPLSVTTYFYIPCVEDADATVHARELRSGSRFAHATATLSQESRERSSCTAVLGTLPDRSVERVMTPPPIDLPPPEKCHRRESGDHSAQGFPIPLADMVDIRVDRDFGSGGPAHFGAWIRFADDSPADPIALGLFADALPPAILFSTPRAGWVPTLELTVHVRRFPVEGWIRASVSADDVQGNLLIEDVLLWDESDTLVAQARQLAMLLV